MNKRLVSIILILVLITSMALMGCSAKKESEVKDIIGGVDSGPNENVSGENEDVDEKETEESVAGIDLSSLDKESLGEKNIGIDFKESKFIPQVQEIDLNSDLSNVENMNQFGSFTESQRLLLSRNHFFVSESNSEQLFYIYENNDYLNIPSFISTDSVLQAYHIFYDYTLRKLERDMLYEALVQLSDSMLKSSLDIYNSLEDEKVKESALKNIAYFIVAKKVLNEPISYEIPEKALDMAEKEYRLVEKHDQRYDSNIFNTMMDYTQFIPRGHYTRSEEFERFFKAMMWYGQVPFPFEIVDDEGKTTRMDEEIISGTLMTIALFKDNGIENWDKIYSPTAFYVGYSDDVTPYQYLDMLKKVFKDGEIDLNRLSEDKILDSIVEESKKISDPRIKQDLYMVAGDRPGEKQFRFMGQRYIADSEILQRLSLFDEGNPNNHRPFPKGLDVMSVMGSERAYDILINVYEEDKNWDQYVPRTEELKNEFDSLEQDTWMSNLYYGWLWTLQPLLEEIKPGYPLFMQNEAWLDKSLNTSLASWAELRHDTILYAKQSGAECGGGDMPPEPPKGYVEPNVKLYDRLLWLTKYSKDNLEQRKLLDDELVSRFNTFVDIIDFLRRVSIKELTNQQVTREEYDQIKVYGAMLEDLTATIASDSDYARWFEITSETDKNMAVIADVHTSLDTVLEEGVGHASEIYVVVPIEGKLYLTRGAVFSYYEFKHPASDRLTDEKWQEILKGNNKPSPPVWTKSFIDGIKEEIPVPENPYISGC